MVGPVLVFVIGLHTVAILQDETELLSSAKSKHAVWCCSARMGLLSSLQGVAVRIRVPYNGSYAEKQQCHVTCDFGFLLKKHMVLLKATAEEMWLLRWGCNCDFGASWFSHLRICGSNSPCSSVRVVSGFVQHPKAWYE